MTLARSALVVALTITGLRATNLEAVIQPRSPLADKVYRHPSLHVPHELQSLAQLPPGLASTMEQDLAALGLGADSAFYDARAGRLTSLILSEPLVPGTGVGNTLQWPGGGTADEATMRDAAWSAVLGYLRRHEAVLRVDVAELGDPRVAVHEHGSLIQVYAQRRIDGIPVRDASVTAVINHGNLVLLGLTNWGDTGDTSAAQIGADEARSVVAEHAQPFVVESFPKDAHLEYVPMVKGDGYDFRLVWVVRAALQGDGGTWEGLVDAVSGELIAFEDKNQYGAATVRKAFGGVYPVSNDQVPPDGIEQRDYPMPFLNVSTPGGPVTTNAGGMIGCVDGTISTSMAGRYTLMADQCGAANEASTGDLFLGFGPTATATDCQVPAGHSPGDTKASRTGLYELTRINEQARGYLPTNAWLNGTLTANMNINLVCNAFWDGLTVNFYRDNNNLDCRNTGEIAGIFDHEWGHGLDNNGLNPSISSPGESIADVHAFLRLNNSCVGRGLFKAGTCSGYGDPCTTCTGVRDADWAKHVSNQPHGIPWILASCPAAGTRGPCNRETHCEGQVPAESGWDLYARDLQAFGLDANTALELTTRLFYLGGQPVGSWYTCAAGCAAAGTCGCNADGGYLNLLAVDDDNGSILDGTPHMTAIFAAFNRHNIACNLPAVSNSGCVGSPSTAPTLTATGQDQGAAVSWTSVPNAVQYNVYRTEGTNGVNFGKVKIAETTGLTFVDSSLQNDRTYFFSVMAVGASPSCLGPMGSTSVVPTAGPNLFIRPVVSVALAGGDGDDFLDNCETATLGFTVENTGNLTLNNVRVVAVVPITHPATIVITSLPSPVAPSLTACAAATGSVSIRPQGLTFDATTQIRIDITADELVGQVRSVIATIAAVESDFQAVASRTYTFNLGMDGWTVAAGTFNRVDAGAGNFYLASSTCLDNHCDIVRSPMVRLQATSALSLQQRYDTETPVPTPYDRANVGIFDIGANTRTVVSPTSGDIYDLPPGAANGTCETTLQAGWAADTDADCTASASFQASNWTTAALNPGGIFNGRSVRLSIHYGADPAASGYGFHFDNVTLTNVLEQVPDVQSNTCSGCPAITVNPATIPAGTAGTAYSQTFTQTGGAGTITWSVSGALPNGITLNPSTGVLSGTPTQAGSFPITITATDGNGCAGSRAYTLVINCVTITVNPATIPAGTAGTAYSQTFTQTGGAGTITWSVTGALPTGITLNPSTGVLSGTPTQTGSFPITVTATDANGCIGSRGYTLVINCQTITVNPATIPAGTAGTAYSQTFTQTSGIGTIAWSVTGTLPTGITLNPSTGVLSGTPTQTGSFPITVRATDGNACFGTRAYTLVINCQAITVNPTTIPAGTAGTAYSQTFTQTSGIGTITWSVTGALPTGITLNPSTGVLSGTPTQTGSFPITVTATDANGCIGSRAYTLVIGCQTITVNPATIPAGTAGTAYSQTFTQTSGIGTIAWSVTGTLPAGITLNPSTGVLSGTPTQIGSFPITITATDANACAGSRGYTLVIGPAGPFVPTALNVDVAGNRVFEPGETVVVAPSWRNDTGAPQAVTGAATNFIGPGTPIYTISDATASYGTVAAGATSSCSTGGDCYGLGVSVANPRPMLHWDSTFLETLSTTHTKTWRLHIGGSFTDVPPSNGFYRFIETILHKNVTGGCTATAYCPSAPTTRDQMAVFVIVAKEGIGFLPPACSTPVFNDVPASHIFCRWIEELARRGVVSGCGGGNYCPSSAVTREQMAVFVLRTLDPALNPPACLPGSEMFADVPASSVFCRWIEELARRGVVTGCGGGNYCPTAAVSREQMGVFLTVTFGLTLYGL